MISVGLTGGIGVGKTTVAGLFSQKGAIVMDADQIVHKFLMPENQVSHQIVSLWGPSILIPGENRIDRNRLAEKVFKGPDSLKRHLDILYPPLKKEVMREMARAKVTGAAVFLLDASQILEAGWETMFDFIVLVRSRFDICLRRLSEQEESDPRRILIRQGFQWPDWVKLRYADFMIDNNGPLWRTRNVVDRIFDRWREISKTKVSSL